MCRRVDAVRAAGNDGPATPRKVVAEIRGNAGPVRRGAARADDRDSASGRLVEAQRSADPEHERWGEVSTAETGRDLHRVQRPIRPLVVLRGEESDVEPLGVGEVRIRAVLVPPGGGQPGDPGRHLT